MNGAIGKLEIAPKNVALEPGQKSDSQKPMLLMEGKNVQDRIESPKSAILKNAQVCVVLRSKIIFHYEFNVYYGK